MRHGLGLHLLLASVLLSEPVAAQEAYVTAQLAGEVAVVDLGLAKVVAHIPLDGAPAGIALSPDRKTAYVTRPEGQSIAVIDLDARKVTSSLALAGGPLGICVDPTTGTIYVADWYASRVLVLKSDPDGVRQTGEIAVGKSPSGLAVTPDGRTLLVANREADSVSVVDIAAGKESEKIPVGQHPFGLTLSADGSRAYTANVTSNDVSVIDVVARREIGRIRTGERPYVVALAGGRGFVTDQYSNTVTVFGLGDLKGVGSIDVEDHPEGIAASQDGKTLYVANWGDNALSVIDVETLKVTGRIAVPDGPRAFGDFLR
ncbi:MAG: YncE family protein [Methylobacterium sp.]